VHGPKHGGAQPSDRPPAPPRPSLWPRAPSSHQRRAWGPLAPNSASHKLPNASYRIARWEGTSGRPAQPLPWPSPFGGPVPAIHRAPPTASSPSAPDGALLAGSVPFAPGVCPSPTHPCPAPLHLLPHPRLRRRVPTPSPVYPVPLPLPLSLFVPPIRLSVSIALLASLCARPPHAPSLAPPAAPRSRSPTFPAHAPPFPLASSRLSPWLLLLPTL